MCVHFAEGTEDSRAQDLPVSTQSPPSKAKLSSKPHVSSLNGALSAPNPIMQRLPAFLDNHNYAKSPMQVGFCTKCYLLCLICHKLYKLSLSGSFQSRLLHLLVKNSYFVPFLS